MCPFNSIQVLRPFNSFNTPNSLNSLNSLNASNVHINNKVSIGISAINKIKTPEKLNKGQLWIKYKELNDNRYLIPVKCNENETICSDCGINRLFDHKDSLMICPECGDERDLQIEPDKASYKDVQYEATHFAYKKLGHFKDHLLRIQAKESTKVPEDVLNVVLVEFVKEHGENLADLNSDLIKIYLKKHRDKKYDKYYENRQQIICALTGIKPIVIPLEIETDLIDMFKKFEAIFPKFCPKSRDNLISYPFIGFKFCQMRRYNEYLPYFNLLKTPYIVKDQYSIWKKICNELSWEYIPHEDPLNDGIDFFSYKEEFETSLEYHYDSDNNDEM